jgi:tetratricopeptide (TPR) repeat protein
MDPGTVVAGRFRVEATASSGAMGKILRAVDLETGDKVAIKVMRPEAAAEVDRFLREARVLEELEHPAIVRHIAHGTMPTGEPYLAMEWLAGIDLARRLAKGPLGVDQGLRLVSRAADALAAAHARGIVHRDVKPSNLFLPGEDTDQVKVLDFGIARLTQVTSIATVTGVALGTPGYMAPEQVTSDRSMDARVDVFALGCVLYECLAGRRAFGGDHLMAVLGKILFEEVPLLRTQREDVPEAVEALVARMLAKDPSRRPRDGAALAAEIAAVADAVRLTVPPTAVGEPGAPAPASAGTGSTRGSRPALGADERRLLCVIVASSSDDRTVIDGLAATVGSEQVPALTATLGALRATATQYGARLERMLDGSVIATLAVTGAATDQAALAARCALALRSLLPDAPMVLVTGRGETTGAWTVGEVIDRAVRLLGEVALEEANRPAGQGGARPVRIDPTTARLLDERFEVALLESESRDTAPGGGTGPLAARAIGLLAEREPGDGTRLLMGRAVPCVGRDREIGGLVALLDECLEESVARVAVLTGPPGVGKSRVRHELVNRIRDRGVQIWLGRCDPMSAGSPFGVLGQAIRRGIGLRDGEPLAARQKKLRAFVERSVPAADQGRVTEFVGELLGVRFPDEASPALSAARRDAVLMGDQMRRAFEDLLAAESARQPVVLVLEDMQWGDLPSVRFVDAALRNLSDRPWLVVCVGRPEVQSLFPGLWSERGAQELRLSELGRRAAERLVREVLGERATDALVAQLVERAAGNALYLEELLRAVADNAGDVPPDSVLAMVQARLEALPTEARRVLRAASVFGQVFWTSGVRALLGDDAARVPAELAELAERELVTRRGEGRFPAEDEWVFRHGLVQGAAYASLTDGDRTLGHRLAAEFLERAGEREAVALAEHFERGGEPVRASAMWRRAGAQALEGNDLDVALSRVDRGLALGAAGTERGALLALRADVQKWRGEFAEAARSAGDALPLLTEGEDLWWAAAGELGVALGKLGRKAELVELGRRVAARWPAEGVVLHHVTATARIAMQLLFNGEPDEAAPLVERVLTAPADDALTRARGAHLRATPARFAGDPSENLEAIAAAAGFFAEVGSLRDACFQSINAGYGYTSLGLYQEGEVRLREATAAADRLGVGGASGLARQNLALALLGRGSLAEARDVLSELIERGYGEADRRLHGYTRIYLAETMLGLGDPQSAEAEARAAIELLVATPPARTFALAVLARVLLAEGLLPAGLEAAREAQDQLEALGGIDEGEATVRLVFAEAVHASGDAVTARMAIAAAKDRLLARARLIRREEWRRSFLESVPDNARTLALSAAWG